MWNQQRDTSLKHLVSTYLRINLSGQAYSVMAEEADVYVVGSGPEDNARLLDKQGGNSIETL